MVPGTDGSLTSRLHRDARAVATAQLRAERAHARAVLRRERRVRKARLEDATDRLHGLAQGLREVR